MTSRSDSVPLDPDKARAQHADYTAVLALGGFEVGVVPPDEAYPDSCFVEDAALIVGERAILTRPGHPSRFGETAGVATALGEHMPVVALEEGRLDGGDVLQVGDSIFVGLSRRTDAAGVESLRAVVEKAVVPVEVRAVLHLKSGVSAIADDAVLWHPAACARESLSGLDVVEVSGDDPEAANVVRLPDGSIVVAAHHRQTAQQLEQLGATVVTVDVSEFARADGGLTCLSVRTGEGLPS